MRKIKIGSICAHLFLIILFVSVIYPFIYALLASFKSTGEILTASSIFPEKVLWKNYSDAWTIAKFSSYTWNSVWYSAISVISALLTSAVGGYVFQRGDFRGKKVIFAVFSSLMFITLGSASMYPQLEILRLLGISGTLWGVIIMHFFGVNITNIYLVKSYLESIPKELDEAAKIDGCNFTQIMFKIIFPIIKPVMATVGIISFGLAWNDYLWPMIVTLSNPAQRTLSVGMIALKGDANAAASWNLILAGAMISAIPMTIVYLIFNQYFIKGMAAGAVKG